MSTDSEVSGLDYEETELTLGLPGGAFRAAAAAATPPESERKRGFADSGADKTPAAKAQVVGWPPVRSFRRNALRSSGAATYVKVAVDGAPYLRKVDLETYGGYDELMAALQEMFSCFTIRDYPGERRLVDPVSGTEYEPTYEDKDGDWMLVGDVPWKMFVKSCKRLRLMKSSEAINSAPREACGTNAN